MTTQYTDQLAAAMEEELRALNDVIADAQRAKNAAAEMLAKLRSAPTTVAAKPATATTAKVSSGS